MHHLRACERLLHANRLAGTHTVHTNYGYALASAGERDITAIGVTPGVSL